MSVRRLLMLLLLVGSLLALPVPASAGPRTDAAFVRATNADRREAGLRSMATSATLAKLARSHSIAMARKSAGAPAPAAPCGTTTSPGQRPSPQHPTTPGWRWPRGIL